MTETRTGRGRRGGRGGGLPDDDDALDALSALANAALPSSPPRPLTPVPSVQEPRQPVRPAPAAPQAADPATALAAPPARAPVPLAAQPAPAAPLQPVRSTPPAPVSDSEDEPVADGTENFIRQSTVQVDAQVARRFRKYQDKEKPKPSNAEVIFRAIDAAQDRYRDIIDARRPQLPEGRRFGHSVPGRRPAGTRLATQINFRPTVGEESAIKKLSKDSGADSMSAFINAVLDEFLPGGGSHPVRAI
jgi:hypothetical protein